ncbi:MAG: hypothetical protein IIC82_05165 [Chloroflexi bacterium]|nr:hypothetical protein [Chloroflexota bacterium]
MSFAPLLLLGGAVLLLGGKKRAASSRGGAAASNGQGSAEPEGHTNTNGGSIDPPDTEDHGSGSQDDASGGYWDSDGGNPIWVPEGEIPPPFWLPEHGEGSQYSGLWAQRQEKLYDLGYRDTESEYAADGILGERTVELIKEFQRDWNWFVGYLMQINPNRDYEDPYTKSADDGSWGPGTDSRVNKALNKFSGADPVYVEELGSSVQTFQDMISGLKGL